MIPTKEGPTRLKMRKVFVVAFAPDFTGISGVGGLEWRYKRADAVKVLQDFLKEDFAGSGTDYTFRTMPVYAHLSAEEITAHLDSRRDLIDLPIPEKWQELAEGDEETTT